MELKGIKDVYRDGEDQVATGVSEYSAFLVPAGTRRVIHTITAYDDGATTEIMFLVMDDEAMTADMIHSEQGLAAGVWAEWVGELLLEVGEALAIYWFGTNPGDNLSCCVRGVDYGEQDIQT